MFLKFLNPYDRCTSKLILLLFASTRALLIPVSMKFSMYSSCRLIFLLSSTNESIFDLLAHDIQFFNSEAASSRFCSFKMFLNDSFNSYPRYNLGSLALICASFTSWFSVRFSGAFPNEYLLFFISFAFDCAAANLYDSSSSLDGLPRSRLISFFNFLSSLFASLQDSFRISSRASFAHSTI